MDKALVEILAGEALRSARATDYDKQCFGNFERAAELATARIYFVFDYSAGILGLKSSPDTEPAFAVYASEARALLQRDGSRSGHPVHGLALADMLLAEAVEIRAEFTTEAAFPGLGQMLKETGNLTPLLLAFNVLTDIAAIEPPIHSQAKHAVERLTPFVKAVCDA